MHSGNPRRLGYLHPYDHCVTLDSLALHTQATGKTGQMCHPYRLYVYNAWRVISGGRRESSLAGEGAYE